MRVKAIVIRIIRQFFRDKRTLGLMLIAPMFVLLLMSLVFDSGNYQPSIGAINLPQPLIDTLLETDATIIPLKTEKEALVKMHEKELDGYLTLKNQESMIVFEGSDPTINKAVLMIIQKALSAGTTNGPGSMQPEVSYLYGSAEMAMFDNLGPVLIGFFIFFFVFLIAGVSFLRERTGGTLDRLLSTPLRRWEIVLGYVIGFGIFTTFQASLISWFAIKVLDIMMVGSFGYVLLITFLLAMTALTLGTFLSAFANNELQMIQFIPIIIVPQVFLSGLFNVDAMAEWLRSIGHIMPLTYGANALREIMIRGKGWDYISTDVYILLGFSLLFTIMNIIALKKYRYL